MVDELKGTSVTGKVLHADEHHEHVLLSGHYNSHWFGQTHALISTSGNVELYQFGSTQTQPAEMHLSSVAMDALVEAWQRRKAQAVKSLPEPEVHALTEG